MNEPSFPLDKAHRHFGVQFNNSAWSLLEKPDRSEEQGLQMLHEAHASLVHWSQIGNAANRQRGECLVALAHAALGDGSAAVRHAEACMQTLEAHPDLMADWDHAFAWDAMARAQRAAGNEPRARECADRAGQASAAIKDPKDREIVDSWRRTF